MPEQSPIVDAEVRLEALNPLQSYCVTAPAGSGKTELLIQRFLTVLARVNEPEEVLAITFTRKAAAEMRARVVAALKMAQFEAAPTDQHRHQTWTLARLVLQASDTKGWQLLKLPSRLSIRTIDSWNAYLTRQMPVLSNFGGPSSPVDDANAYYLSAARSMLELTAAGHWIADDLSRTLLYFDNNWARLEQLMAGMLMRREQWLPHLGGHLNSEVAEQTVQDSIRSLVADHLLTLSQSMSWWTSNLEELEAYSATNLERDQLSEFPGAGADSLQAWLRIAELLLTGQGGWRKQVTKNHGFPAGEGKTKAEAQARKNALYALIGELSEQANVQQQLQMLRFLPHTGADTDDWLTLASLARLLPVLAAQLSVVFQQEGVVDYAQISIAANAALGDEDSATDLAMKLDYRLQHLLIDEFQDTSVTQFELLRRLTRNWANDNHQNPDNPNTLFIVGDGMQSIYGFRDADVSLFVQARNEGVSGLHLHNLELHTNFRSQAGLVDWIGDAFSQAFPVADDLALGAVRFSPSAAFRAQQAESVTLLGYHSATGDNHSSEAAALVETIQSGMEDAGCESIAVLVRTRRHLIELIRVLKQHDIAWQAQDIDQLGQSPVVTDLINLCQAIHNYTDDAAWLGLLRGPWCGLSLEQLHKVCESHGDASLWSQIQNETIIEKLDSEGRAALSNFVRVMQRGIARRERLPMRVWLEQIWLELRGPSAVLNESQLADARDFFDLIEDMDALGQPYVRELLLQKVARLFSQPSHPGSKLQLMTLHRSKGLEFDWVIIPGLARRPRNDQRDMLLWDDFLTSRGQRGFLLAADSRGQDDGTVYAYLQEQHKRRRDIEATRLLYVGCTRARDRLFLSAVLKDNKEGDDVLVPAPRSLLAKVWPAFRASARMSSASTSSGAVETAQLKFRRLAPPKRAEAEPVPTVSEDNLPAREMNLAARETGNLIHLSLQRLSLMDNANRKGFDPDAWEPWWRHYLQSRLPDAAVLKQVLQRVRDALAQTLAGDIGAWLLDSGHQDSHSEFAISHIDEKLRLRDYVIDRTFIDGDVRWIIDYKSAAPGVNQDLEGFLQIEEARYSSQLALYKKAMQGLDSRAVKTALYFTSLAHLHECG